MEIDINVGAATIPLNGGELQYTGGIGGAHTLTVKGNGATVNQTTVGARVFGSTSTNTSPLALDGMTITGGNVTGATQGAAVRSSRGLTIANSTVTLNTAGTDIIHANNTTITNSTIANNTVTATGAQSCDGILDTAVTTVTSSRFMNNTCNATGTGDANGTFDTGDTTVTNTTVTGEQNTAVTGTAQGTLFPNKLTMSGSVVQNNTNTSTSGGSDGIIDSSATTITGSAIVGNTNTTTSGDADGTVFPSTMTMTNSTVANNTNSTGNGVAVGAGINMENETLSLTNSTVANNTNIGTTASDGGGIFQGSSGTGSAAASTPKHGTAKGSGVGATATVSTTLVYDTIVGNRAATGANLDVATLISFSSVVALHNGGVNCVLANPATSNGYNYSDDATCGFTAATDKQNAADPGLGPVSNNGGPAPTRLPLPGSPLIDAIPVASCQADGAAGIATDERGVIRPQGNGCDIGAVEVIPALVVTPRFTG